MIEIVTGHRDSGKTSHLLNLYNKNQTGDGLLSIKHIHPATSQTTGYHLLHLSTQTTRPLAQRSPAGPLQLGDFSFAPNAFTYAETILNDMITHHIRPIYLDEIGLLELNGHGFAPILPRLITQAPHLILTIRHRYLSEALKTFNIPSPTIIKI
jgi:nucleoside-triphosphatase THEP1